MMNKIAISDKLLEKAIKLLPDKFFKTVEKHKNLLHDYPNIKKTHPLYLESIKNLSRTKAQMSSMPNIGIARAYRSVDPEFARLMEQKVHLNRTVNYHTTMLQELDRKGKLTFSKKAEIAFEKLALSIKLLEGAEVKALEKSNQGNKFFGEAAKLKSDNTSKLISKVRKNLINSNEKIN